MKRHLRITVNGRSYDIVVETVVEAPKPSDNRTPVART
jgi:hypothetical protein